MYKKQKFLNQTIKQSKGLTVEYNCFLCHRLVNSTSFAKLDSQGETHDIIHLPLHSFKILTVEILIYLHYSIWLFNDVKNVFQKSDIEQLYYISQTHRRTWKANSSILRFFASRELIYIIDKQYFLPLINTVVFQGNSEVKMAIFVLQKQNLCRVDVKSCTFPAQTLKACKLVANASRLGHVALLW